jgi:hypothetical protein
VDALRAIDPYDAPTISRTFGRVAFGGGLIPPVSPRRLVPQGSAAIEVSMRDKKSWRMSRSGSFGQDVTNRA